MRQYTNQFPRMVGFRLSWDEADKLDALVRLTGLTKSTLVRELVKRATVEKLLAPVCDAPDELSVS